MTTDIRRRIDAARQVLVGVVPNPTSQIDQITNALLYKFMDFRDQQATDYGGERTYFTGDLEQYAWTRLMNARVGNQERMKLYSEALTKFSRAEQLPELFRDIFASAFLPYRSPETLGLFLREIDHFDCSHPEELGNAYEYLLSIMSSQGDAGQFRTPRHIIDFIVDVVNPTKNDRILDPACGTGGFLVSSYRHILEQHDGKNDPEEKEKPLTPDERKKLATNFEGYDIDPGMARIARVNLYLHQFKDPKIHQYNTLSDDERWKDKFSVILANPPFMSPKGGTETHDRFSIESSRSEVLFVDYIMSHLRPNGRAGIIVPEGIIFQSGRAYKQLRKNLINDGLYAAVSLPSGVFMPYSGIKTSVLLFNNQVAAQRNEILLVKVESDGFHLGATRRQINKNDLPTALDILHRWRTGEKVESKLALYVKKAKIAEDGEYNLSGDRYREVVDYSNVKWPSFTLKELEERGDITLGRGQVISKKDLEADPGIYPVYSSSAQGKGEFGQYGKFMFNEELISWSVDGGGRFFYRPKHKFSVTNVSGWLRINSPQKINARYLYRVLDAEWQEKSFDYVAKAHPSVIRGMYKIPLPPLEIQEKIAAEVGQHQKVIDGAKQIGQNCKPSFRIDPKWEKVKLGKVCEIKSGGTPSTSQSQYYKNGTIPWLKSEVCKDAIVTEAKTFITEEGLKNSSAKWLSENTTLIALVGATIGRTAFIEFKATTNQNIASLYPKDLNQLDPFYLYLASQTLYDDFMKLGGGGFKMANLTFIKNLEIPVPPLEAQAQIVAEIEAENELVESAKKLIPVYEKKTAQVIDELWSKRH